MAGGRLGELGGVEPLEVRRRPPLAEGLVAAVRAGMVADVEVGPRLRGGEHELAADGTVAQDDRHEEEGGAEDEETDRGERAGLGWEASDP